MSGGAKAKPLIARLPIKYFKADGLRFRKAPKHGIGSGKINTRGGTLGKDELEDEIADVLRRGTF
jgi:hypothetical protein